MSAPSPRVGHVLAHYRLVELIGVGGMGMVYRARDEQLERDVAVKVLPPGSLSDDAARSRFKKEALALAKLNHPAIATIFEFGSDQGVDFLVIEYIRGITLDAKLASGALSEKEVILLGIQLAQGLAAAHDQGVIHRDLKPGNLRITLDGRLKILDFGLAQLRLPVSESAETETVSKPHEVKGTLPYMAPEQLRGQRADTRCDVYAAGAVLYEMGTAHRPFESKISTALAADIIHTLPPQPRAFNKNLSRGLQQVILKCLEKEPARRYQTALELQTDLERLNAGLGQRTTHRLTFLAVGGALALLLAVGIGLHFLRHREQIPPSLPVTVKPRPSVAVLGFRNLSGKSDVNWVSTALLEMLNTELAAGEKVRTIPGEDVAHMKIELSLPDADSLGRETLARLRKNLGSDFVVLGSYLDVNGRVRLDLRLQDAHAGETVATFSATGTETELPDLATRTGEQMREKLGIGTLSPADALGLKASAPSNPEAMRLYSEGLDRVRLFDAVVGGAIFYRRR